MATRCRRVSGRRAIARCAGCCGRTWPRSPVISLLYDQGLGQAALDCATVGVFAVLAQLRLGGRRAQSLVVTLGLLTVLGAARARLRRGAASAYFHFFVMVAALSLYEDWVPFGAAVAFVLVQQGITAAIVDYDGADSPWLWALVHSAFIGALSIVLPGHVARLRA